MTRQTRLFLPQDSTSDVLCTDIKWASFTLFRSFSIALQKPFLCVWSLSSKLLRYITRHFDKSLQVRLLHGHNKDKNKWPGPLSLLQGRKSNVLSTHIKAGSLCSLQGRLHGSPKAFLCVLSLFPKLSRHLSRQGLKYGQNEPVKASSQKYTNVFKVV